MFVPRLTLRYDRLVELVLPANAEVAAYQVGAANTLDAAFAGTTAMFKVGSWSGSTYRSRGIRERGLGRTQYENRGLVRAVYDPEDFWPLSPATLPHDAHTGYLRVAVVNTAGVVQPEGPIFVLPTPGFMSTPRPSLSVTGTAPNVAATATLLPPSGALHFVLPLFADRVSIQNRDPLVDLFVSFDKGQTELMVPATETRTFFESAVSEVYIRGAGGAVVFDMSAALVNGEMA